MESKSDRFPLLRKILKAIGLSAEAVDDIVERILDWLVAKDTPVSNLAVLPFKLRDDFLSPAERSFYQVLRTTLGEQALVFTKINLADLFFSAAGDHRQNRILTNRIDRKHVDFLICDAKSVRPLVALELDDQSHARAERVARDQWVEQVFAAADLPLLRIPAKTGYSRQQLQDLLQPFLTEFQPAANLVTAQAIKPVAVAMEQKLINAAMAPACPKCDLAMLLRTAKSGASAGNKFWGCANYPRCRAVLPYTP